MKFFSVIEDKKMSEPNFSSIGGNKAYIFKKHIIDIDLWQKSMGGVFNALSSCYLSS